MSRRSKARQERVRSDEMRIYISPIMFVMAVYFVAMGMAYEFVCSLAAVLLHECAHAAVAKKLGYALDTVKLMPYGAALCGDENIRPAHEALIAIAGPLFNLALAVALLALWWLFPAAYMFTQPLFACNLYIGLFNLLPVYPLDGGRVALALLSIKKKRSKAYRIMRIVSAVAGIAALCLFGLTAVRSSPNICLLSVGAFMVVSAFVPDGKAGYRALFSPAGRMEKLRTPLEVRRFAVADNADLALLCGSLDPDRYTEFAVFGSDMKVVAVLDEGDVVKAAAALGYTATAAQAAANTHKNG